MVQGCRRPPRTLFRGSASQALAFTQPPRYGKQMRVHDRHCSKQSRGAKQKSKNKAPQ